MSPSRQVKKDESLMSTRSASNKIKKTRKTQSMPSASLTTSEPEVARSRRSISPLAKAYQSPEFVIAWDNDIRFHIAQNIVHLRRYRKKSQISLAKLMHTSQSAIARMEGGSENVTLDTLQRIAVALRGRLHIVIQPEEKPVVWDRKGWWAQTDGCWDLVDGARGATTDGEWVVLALGRKNLVDTFALSTDTQIPSTQAAFIESGVYDG